MDREDPDSDDGNPPIPGGNEALSQFIENLGLHYEDYDLPRIAGRIIGLLLVSPEPISSEEMAEALQVSRSSISTNLRTLLMAELIEKVSLPGERVDYYAISPETWQRSLEMRLATFLPLRDAAREGLDGMKQDDACRKRLLEMIDWVDMVEGLMQDLAGRWQSRKKTPEMPG